jgi:hypothetical protein
MLRWSRTDNIIKYAGFKYLVILLRTWHMASMKKEFAIFRSIKREVSATGYLRRAQQRATRRKSLWNLILIPLFLGGAGLITYALFQIMWRIHIIIYPAHIGKLGEFWGEGIGDYSADPFIIKPPGRGHFEEFTLKPASVPAKFMPEKPRRYLHFSLASFMNNAVNSVGA